MTALLLTGPLILRVVLNARAAFRFYRLAQSRMLIISLQVRMDTAQYAEETKVNHTSTAQSSV